MDNKIKNECILLFKYIPDHQIRSSLHALLKNGDILTARMIIREVIFHYEESDFVDKLRELYIKLKQIENDIK